MPRRTVAQSLRASLAPVLIPPGCADVVPPGPWNAESRDIAISLLQYMKPRLRDSTPRAENLSEILKAVAHPLRLRIVARLCGGAEHVNGLARALGAPQPIVSQQLRILRNQRLVAVARTDGLAMYRLREPALRDLVCCMDRCAR